MKFSESGAALAKDMGAPVTKMQDSIDAHYEASFGNGPRILEDRSPHVCHGTKPLARRAQGRSCATTSFRDPISQQSPILLQFITPVIHNGMGGLEIDEDSVVLGSGSEAIRGLYAADEVAGGVHGNNRLEGHSLLACVVFGRVAGAARAKYTLGDKVKATSFAELSGGGLSGNVEVSKLAGESYEDTMSAASNAPAKKQKKASSGHTMKEVD